jgi:hypothetical protein
MRPPPWSLLLVFCLTLAGCDKSRPDHQDHGGAVANAGPHDAPPEPAVKANGRDAIIYPLLDKVTRVEVRARHRSVIKTLIAGEQLDKVVAFVNGQREGWERPWAGIPIPQVTAGFYDGETFKGHFGVGRGFFETHREGEFASKRATAAECAAFLLLIGVDKKTIED